MTIERVRTVDLTRYVRTPAGAAFYHLPIGSPIAGGRVNIAEKVAAPIPDVRAAPGVKYRVRIDPKTGLPVVHTAATKPLKHHEARQVEHALNSAKTPQDVKDILLHATETHRPDLVRHIIAQHKAADDYLAASAWKMKSDDIEAKYGVIAGLCKILPWLKHTLTTKFPKEKLASMHDIGAVKLVLDEGLRGIIGSVAGTALAATMATVGIHLIGG